MGVDKASLLAGGELLWARQLRVLRDLKPDALWVSARKQPAWCPPEIETILDEPPSRGPLSGLSAALKKMQTTHLLALAIDLPRIEPTHLRRLWKLARPGCGVIPMNGDQYEPLCAIYPGGEISVTAAESALSGDDVSLRGFAGALLDRGRLRVVSVAEAERNCFLNANTPEEFASISSGRARGWND